MTLHFRKKYAYNGQGSCPAQCDAFILNWCFLVSFGSARRTKP